MSQQVNVSLFLVRSYMWSCQGYFRGTGQAGVEASGEATG